ncbi:pyridoxamine 5'-phosphate oxidase family protein [Streptomonospora sp. PA3]|uniref:pyridoxamine 5'-phosphate oxidase family protein n=1 Tax=Streptomonospora sp. PA3 TaxID=2607326 RepID=UPI0012DE7A8E|nr:pyridoxamine 5'-phosphate oxidase family protein [Streptomonospora sp. PA3]MUL43362.1 pyridoxamine 5'-phosphate oxidase family protein [Streptomonospora sp. PA3]
MADQEAASYAPSPRTSPTRHADRAAYDRETVHAVLDAEYICHLGFVADGDPVVLPTLYARVGERLYLHGSTGGRPLRNAREGLRVCVTVTLVDGVVLARSAMHHSLNYRSVVAHGLARRVTDPAEHRAALDALLDAPFPGRAGDCRPPTAKELAQTAVLRLDLEEVSAKTRSGGVSEEPEDAGLPYWAGVVPARRAYGSPEPDTGGVPAALPDYLRALPS